MKSNIRTTVLVLFTLCSWSVLYDYVRGRPTWAMTSLVSKDGKRIKVSFGSSGTLKIVIYVENYPQECSASCCRLLRLQCEGGSVAHLPGLVPKQNQVL